MRALNGLLFFAFLFPVVSFGQSVPNGSFEETRVANQGNLAPKKWSHHRNLLMVFSNAPDKPIDGQYAVALTNFLVPSKNYDSSVAWVSNRFSISKLHSKLEAFVKYYQNDKNEKFFIRAILFNNKGFGILDTVAYGEYRPATDAELPNWTKIAVGLTYRKNIEPDSALIQFFTSGREKYTSQTTLLVDGVEFTDTLTALSNQVVFKTRPQLSIYPNPAKSILNIEGRNVGNQQFSYLIFDLLGRTIKSGVISNLEQQAAQISLENIKGGAYFIKTISKDKSIEKTHEFVILE